MPRALSLVVKKGSKARLATSAAMVRDRDEDILAGDEIGLPRGIILVEEGVLHLDREPPARRHGVAPVHRQVEDRIFELAGIDLGRPGAAREHGFDLDALAERAFEQLGHAADELVDVDDSGLERLAAGEGEQPPRERGGADGAFIGAFEIARNIAVSLADALPGKAEIADDDGEHIIEIMSDAAGELAHHLQPLELADLLLGGFAHRDLAGERAVRSATRTSSSAASRS